MKQDEVPTGNGGCGLGAAPVAVRVITEIKRNSSARQDEKQERKRSLSIVQRAPFAITIDKESRERSAVTQQANKRGSRCQAALYQLTWQQEVAWQPTVPTEICQFEQSAVSISEQTTESKLPLKLPYVERCWQKRITRPELVVRAANANVKRHQVTYIGQHSSH